MKKMFEIGLKMSVAASLAIGSLQTVAAGVDPLVMQQNWSGYPFFKYPASCTQTNVMGTYTLNTTEGTQAGFTSFTLDYPDYDEEDPTLQQTIPLPYTNQTAVPLAGMIAFDGTGRYRASITGPFNYGKDTPYPNYMSFDGYYQLKGCQILIVTELCLTSPCGVGEPDEFMLYANINPLQNSMTFSGYLEEWYPIIDTVNSTTTFIDVFFGGIGQKASTKSLIQAPPATPDAES